MRLDPALTQPVVDKDRLGLGVCLAIVAKRFGQVAFQSLVTVTERVVGAQRVTKCAQFSHVRVVVLDQVEVMGSSVGLRP
jgi:hypothetical protein